MIIIVSAPSGSGKSTLVSEVRRVRKDVQFSISATTRNPRGQEENGREYYFVTTDEFKDWIEEGRFIEYQEVYPGLFYGSLKSEIARIESTGNHVIFDMDVYGGLRLKGLYGDKALSIFIGLSDIKTLEERLKLRATDSEEVIEMRVEKAKEESLLASRFDHIIVNDDLDKAKKEIIELVNKFLG